MSKVTGFLTVESATVAADADGVVTSYVQASGSFCVLAGDTPVTTGARFSVASAEGVRISIGPTSGTYSVTDMTGDGGRATLRADYEGVEILKMFSICKSRVGGAAPALPRVSTAPDTKSFSGSYLLYRKAGGGLKRPGGKGQVRPPRFRHPNFDSAETEAKRLLGRFPESTFVVLQEVARVKLKPATGDEVSNG